jgi:origin recognition complex subunit 1
MPGMELRHPFDAYVKFWEALSGPRKERLSAGGAVCELENYFCGDQKGGSSDSDSEEDDGGNVDVGDVAERPVTVLLLDEIDYLITKKETLVYNFFDWPLRGKPLTQMRWCYLVHDGSFSSSLLCSLFLLATTARLVVIGISNTINLPEKLSTRVQSRIGGDRCNFRSYNVQDTITILKTRLGMLGSSDGHPVFEEDAINVSVSVQVNSFEYIITFAHHSL